MIYVYPLIPAVILGTLNWMYWKNQGYTSKVQWVLGIAVFYIISYSVFKYFV